MYTVELLPVLCLAGWLSVCLLLLFLLFLLLLLLLRPDNRTHVAVNTDTHLCLLSAHCRTLLSYAPQVSELKNLLGLVGLRKA